MAKTNFSKVEEMLGNGLRKMKVENLLDMADAAARTQKTPEQKSSPSTEQTDLITALQHDLGALQKQGNKPYAKLGIKKSYLKKLIESTQGLSPEDWETVKKLKGQLEDYKKELAKNLPQISDEDFVEAERRSQKTKRFNIKKNWIPLQ